MSMFLPGYFSAGGSGNITSAHPAERAAPEAFIGTGILANDPGTTSGYMRIVPAEVTGTGGLPIAAQPSRAVTWNVSSAVLELHRLSGLTFAELAGLLGVTRRTLHHWANGRRISAENEAWLYRLLATMRRIDRGEAARNRRLLIEPDDAGVSLFGLLAERKSVEAERRAGAGSGPRLGIGRPLSAEAVAARRPPHPADLLGASRERIATSKPRLLKATPIRLPRRTSRA